MRPAEHDRILGNVSHLPHIMAAALVNASNIRELAFAGKGFMDTSRIASGPANIWTDILMANYGNVVKALDKFIVEVEKIKKAMKNNDARRIEQLLTSAKQKRDTLIKTKIRKREFIS